MFGDITTQAVVSAGSYSMVATFFAGSAVNAGTTYSTLYSQGQVSFDTALGSGQIMTMWLSPKIATSSNDVFTNIICQVTNFSTPSYTNQIWNTATSPTTLHSGKTASNTLAGSTRIASGAEGITSMLEVDATKKSRFYCV
jgi:hypothetical protein